MRRLLKFLAGVLVLLLIGAAGYGAWLRVRPSIANPDEQLFTAEESLMEDVLVVAGQVKPAVTIDMRAEASGTVESVDTDDTGCGWVTVAVTLSVDDDVKTTCTARIALPGDDADNPWARKGDNWRP